MKPRLHPLVKALTAALDALDGLAEDLDDAPSLLDTVASRVEDLLHTLGRSPRRARILSSADDLGVLLVEARELLVDVRVSPFSASRRLLEDLDGAVDNLVAAVDAHRVPQLAFPWVPWPGALRRARRPRQLALPFPAPPMPEQLGLPFAGGRR